MCAFQCWNFPELTHRTAEELFASDKELVVVGIIGKSSNREADKTAVLGFDQNEFDFRTLNPPKEGQIKLLHNPADSMLLVHFETTYDMVCMEQMLNEEIKAGKYGQFLPFNQRLRNRFARMLLFATQVCHIIVFVELSVTFDASLLPIFKALRIIRDKHILRFLPKLLKNSITGNLLGKYGRLCSPRMLFLFEHFPDGYDKTPEALSKLEFEIEDNIYRMLCNESIIANNSGMSLFSIPGNKRFVYYNTDASLSEDAIQKSVDILESTLDLYDWISELNGLRGDIDDLLPYKGFGKTLNQIGLDLEPLRLDEEDHKERQFMTLLRDHVDEALKSGFDDNMSKQKSKSHFVILGAKAWYETFQMLYKVFIENPDNPDFEANDPDYKSYLENFDRIMNFDDEFFTACCDIGLQKAFAMYNNPTLTHYSATVHKKLVDEAIALYMKYARGPQTTVNVEKLRQMCETCWLDGKQQCEQLSLRGHPCVLPKHIAHDGEHSSGYIYVSACNCGRTQGRREDPNTIHAANYGFYEFLANNCNLCVKVKKYHFAIFEPSTKDYRAAELEVSFPKLNLSHSKDVTPVAAVSANIAMDDDIDSQPLTASSQTNLSLESIDILENKRHGNLSGNDDDDDDVDENGSLNELVLHVRDKDSDIENTEHEHSIQRQPSTTEYLAGMVHTETPAGLLPLFASWSLVCVGPGSVYSHNTGLLEHFQSGFLSGANFLLPWDVHVRLEHSLSWAAYEKTRYRKMGEVFILKIFIGFEYECPRGHRFIMGSPDKVLRGASTILRDSGSKVVFNNMPLYFPCPCRSSKFDVAQLMRVHVVTPKAPVNVILDPKIRTGERNYLFTLGLPSPPKLSQSAYWVLRLPFIYQGDEGPIAPPSEVTAANALNYGCLMAGMFGVSETEVDE